MPIAPKSTDEVFLTCGCGTSANELAFKLALGHFKKNNPNAVDPEIISFEKSFHGRLFGTLTTTRSKGLHKVAIPAFKWRGAPFPEVKYPYVENEAYNQKVEKECLVQLEELLKTKNVAATIIEPILAEGGDKSASPNFFLGVQELTKKYGALFIVDEVQTGVGPTGKFWAHEHWGPRADPDIVTFAKKMQVSGFFHKSNITIEDPEDFYSKYNADHIRLLNFKTIWRIMQIDRLIRNADHTGSYLRGKLFDLSNKYCISNIRGLGTFLAYDLPTEAVAGKLVKELLNLGVNAGLCGDRSIRVRPSLVFKQKHAEVYVDRLEFALKRLS